MSQSCSFPTQQIPFTFFFRLTTPLHSVFSLPPSLLTLPIPWFDLLGPREDEQQVRQMIPSNLMSGSSSSLPWQMSGNPSDPCYSSSLRRHQLLHHPFTPVCSQCSHLSRSCNSSSSSAASGYRSSYAVRSSQGTSIPSQQSRMKQVILSPFIVPSFSLFKSSQGKQYTKETNPNDHKYVTWYTFGAMKQCIL